MATITTRAGKGAALTHQEVDANFTGLNTELGQKEVASNKGIANGYASLDSAGKVPSAQLPSYVDDVVEVANFASLPGTGETGKIYVTIDTNKTYRWAGSSYIEISASPGSTDSLAEGSTNLYFTQARARASISASGSLSYNSSTGVMSFTDAVTSVAGRSGAVTLTSSDVGLGNAENKSSATIRGEITSGNVTTALGFTPYNATNPSGYISGNQAITVSGDASGSGATSIALTLANSGVSAGTYTKVTVDAKGRVTTGASLASGDLPTYTGTITSGQVTTALGYTPYNATNPSGYITSSASISGSSRFVAFLDNRATNDQPQGKTGYVLSADFKDNSSVNNPPVTASGGYSHILTVAGWDTAGGSGGWPSQLSFGDGIAVRQATNATTWGSWRTVLHSSNYNSYSPTLTGSGASGTWGINITGNAASVTNGVTSGNVTSFAIPASTNFGSGDLNQAYNSGLYGFDIPSNSPGFSYGHILVMRGRGDTIGQLAIDYSTGQASFRGAYLPNGSSTVGAAWSSWRRALDSANYTNYSPSLTGSGASGTWGINVTGTSGSISGYNNPTTAATANTIAYRDGNGDIAAREIVLSSGLSSATPTVLVSMYPSSNQLVRTTPAAVAESMIAYTVRNRGNVDNFDFNTYGNFSSNIVSGYIESSPNKPTAYAYPYGTTLSFNAGPGQAQFYVSHAGNDLTFRGGWAGGSWQTWNRVLTNQNYTSYAPSLTGSGASGTWGISITGSSASTTGNAGSANYATYSQILDTRAGQYTPNNYQDYRATYEFTNQIVGSDWHTAMTMQGWHDGYTAWQIIGPASTSAHENWYLRSGVNTSWNPTRAILHAGNYTSYSPPYSGGTLSGAWYFASAGNTGTNSSPPLQAYTTGSNGAWMSFHRGGSYAVNFGLDSDNVMRIGGWSAAANRWQLDMSGNGTYAGNVTAYSDERLKTDWSVIESGFVERLAVMRCGTYTRIDSGQRQAGVSAQNMRKILPEVVSEDNDGTLALAYGNAALVSAVELAKELVALKQEVAELRARVH